MTDVLDLIPPGELLARPDLAGQPFVTLVGMAVMPLLLWRRSHPLVVCLIGFGVAGVLAVVQLLSVVVLVAGGIMALNKRTVVSYRVLAGAHIVQVLLALYWAARLLDVTVVAVIFLAFS